MRYTLCLLDPQHRGVSDEVRLAHEALPRALGLEIAWRIFDGAAVLTAWDDSWGDSLIAIDGDWLAVGVVRLDNREDVERWAGELDLRLTDLQLALRLVSRTGTKRIRDLLGDFAFVAWHQTAQTVVAATDALGVKKLFYAERNGLVGFASRAEALARGDCYELQHLAELVALCPVTPGLTAYAGVRRLPAGTMAVLEGGALRLQTFWSPEEFETTPYTSALEREAPTALRDLLAESVRCRVAGDGDTWAQLSGGLDSSSIVSMAQWLLERGALSKGVAGTVSYVDWQGTDADEREYSDAVVARWHVRNETIVDPPLWLDGDSAPPRLDQPRDSIAFHPRERRLCAIVRGAGARVLLAGFGSDELFAGTTIFFADWVVQGHLWTALRELARWAAQGRVSFWEVAYGNALLPLIPQRLRPATSGDEGGLLPWIAEAAARRYCLRRRTHSVAENGGRLGRKYRNAMLTRVNAIATQLDAGAIGDALDVRYPFLSRPLVELALRLPPELCVRPHARKWALREAMRAILPEAVRTRAGKGGPTDRLVQSLSVQRDLLDPLVRSPMLAELGIVDPQMLRSAFETASAGGDGDRNLSTEVQATLTTEAWLRIRSGRWPPEPSS